MAYNLWGSKSSGCAGLCCHWGRSLSETSRSPFHLLHQETASAGRCVPMSAVSVLCLPQAYSPLRELALLHGFCFDCQALGTDGQDHNENAHHKCHQGPEKAMQEDNLIMRAMKEHIIWSARQWRMGKKEWSTALAWHKSTPWSSACFLPKGNTHWKWRPCSGYKYCILRFKSITKSSEVLNQVIGTNLHIIYNIIYTLQNVKV